MRDLGGGWLMHCDFLLNDSGSCTHIFKGLCVNKLIPNFNVLNIFEAKTKDLCKWNRQKNLGKCLFFLSQDRSLEVMELVESEQTCL